METFFAVVFYQRVSCISYFDMFQYDWSELVLILGTRKPIIKRAVLMIPIMKGNKEGMETFKLIVYKRSAPHQCKFESCMFSPYRVKRCDG